MRTIILLLLLTPTISHAQWVSEILQDDSDPVAIQREQLKVQKEIRDNLEWQRMNQPLMPYREDPVIVQQRESAQRQQDISDALQNFKYQQEAEAERKANEYYPEH